MTCRGGSSKMKETRNGAQWNGNGAQWSLTSNKISTPLSWSTGNSFPGVGLIVHQGYREICSIKPSKIR
jgi:hypothetical protein